MGAALASAFLFGAGTPLAKWLLQEVNAWMLAGLLYLGSGVGLAIYCWARGITRLGLMPGEGRWLAAAVVCGGGIAPVLLMAGLSALPASHASLLLNAEAVLTTVLAWVLFRENVGTRIALGMVAIVAGAALLSWGQGSAQSAGRDALSVWPAAAVLLACFFWALDNNFTRKVALADAAGIACVKGLSAGTVNLLLAFFLGARLPGIDGISAAMATGFFAYGVSLALFVVGLRHLGASRAGAYFSTAPFVGAVVSVVFLAEPVTWPLLAAAALMATGIWLHLTEHHSHRHRHVFVAHEHAHEHPSTDGHHLHEHVPAFFGTHTHAHEHQPATHAHPHFPDAHHRHKH